MELFKSYFLERRIMEDQVIQDMECIFPSLVLLACQVAQNHLSEELLFELLLL